MFSQNLIVLRATEDKIPDAVGNSTGLQQQVWALRGRCIFTLFHHYKVADLTGTIMGMVCRFPL